MMRFSTSPLISTRARAISSTARRSSSVSRSSFIVSTRIVAQLPAIDLHHPSASFELSDHGKPMRPARQRGQRGAQDLRKRDRSLDGARLEWRRIFLLPPRFSVEEDFVDQVARPVGARLLGQVAAREHGVARVEIVLGGGVVGGARRNLARRENAVADFSHHHPQRALGVDLRLRHARHHQYGYLPPSARHAASSRLFRGSPFLSYTFCSPQWTSGSNGL